MVTNTAKLQEKIMALTNIDGSGGVDILTRSGDFKSTYDILLEISKVWDKMNDVDQAALLELVAGKTRGSVVAALFQNGDVLEKAYKSASDASGSAMRELENHLDSIQGRIDLFTNSLQTMWMNFINADVVKFIVDIGTGLIKLVDKVGVLKVAVAGLFTGMFVKHQMKKNNVDLLSFIFETIPTNIKNTPAIQNFASTFKTAFADAMGGAVKVSSLDILAELANFDDANNVLGDLAGIFGDKSVTKDKAKQILDSFDDINEATKDAILSSNLFAASQIGAATGTNIFTGALATAKAAAIAFGKSLIAFAATHPLITTLTVAVLALGAALAIYDAFTVSHDEYIEKLEEETEALKNVQSELKSVQSELENTKDRMDELQAKGTLSFVEEEELNRLKEQTAELERQEEILLAQEKRARNKQIETAIKAAKTDPNLQDYILTGQATTYLTGGQGDNTTGMPYGAKLQYSEPTQDENLGNNWEINIENLKSAKEDLDVAIKALSETTYDAESKEYKALEKQVENAQARVDKYNNTIDSMNEAWQTEYGEVGYIENATTEAEKQWNEYYRQYQDYVDQWMLINNGYANGKATVLDRIFGVTGTDLAKEFKKEFEAAVNGGKDPAEVIESLLANKDYSSAFSGLEKQFGITMDNIKAYFTQTGEFAIDPNFDITKYTQDIKSHSAVISEFQDAIMKLGKGSFTMDDYLDLIERFPDLAKGVDISSNAFYGLSRNLNKAIKTRTKSFARDLQDLRKSMVAAGKSTDSIDQLIEAIENMPEDALDNIVERYGTLADEIERANVAQDRLLSSMEENPNAGYETRGDALDYMKEAMKNGEIGSESNLWNVAKEYGFTYDSAKTINENADALAKFIAVRETWWKQSDDGDDRTKDGYSYKGAINFIEAVETAVDAAEAEGSRLAEILDWNYDETTGTFDFDFDNKDLTEIISLLGETEGLIGLTNAEWMDLMVQVGQFFEINWDKASDVSNYIKAIADSSKPTADKIDEMTDSVETYVEKALGMDLDFDNLTEDAIDKLETTDTTIKDLLRDYLALKDAVSKNPLNIKVDGNVETDIINPLKEAGLEVNETIDAFGQKQFTFDVIDFESLMHNNGYTTESIMQVMKRLFGENSAQYELIQAREQILNLQSVSLQTKDALDELGIAYRFSSSSQGASLTIESNVDEVLKKYQFTDEEIAKLKAKWESSGIHIDTIADTSGAEDSKDALNEMPENVETTLSVNDDEFQTTMSEAQKTLDDFCRARTATITVNTVTGTTSNASGTPSSAASSGLSNRYYRQSTMYADGTAHAEGSWGVPQTETALMGELGPEIIVRNGRWFTVGENGASFEQVKKGDIIFNHKQSKQLLENGYVTGRGKLHGSAFASGTAFADGGGTFARYSFSGSGGYTKYDVNDNVVDSFGDLSGAASDAADSTDEFKETIDWIEIRLEELDETIGLLNAQLENAVYYAEKNNKIDDIIAKNKEKMANLEAGADYYESYISKFWNKIPAQYQEAAKNGAIAITDFAGKASEEVVEAIQNYREYVQKAADLRQQKEELKAEIRDLAIQKFNNAYDSGDVRATVEDSQTGKLQNAVDYDETRGLITSDAYYVAMMENSNKKIEYLTDARKAMQEELDRAVKAGEITRGSNEWYELIDQMYQIDAQIDEATIELEEFQNAINDIYWENFDQLISRIEYLRDETQSLIDLMDNADMVVTPKTDDGWYADDVQWTDEGLASLGLYAQQMEIAEYQARQYAEAIDDLTTDYEAGLYSENEYLEKLNELKNSQYESIEAYYDAQEAIKDLNQARVDEIKNGIEKQIDAYEKLIEKQKEALEIKKDMYDFEKSIMDQQKNIQDIQRQIDAISTAAEQGDRSAIAKKKQLEAELLKAQEELEEAYHDRSVSNQQDALDKELEHFQEEKEAEIEQWEKYMDDIETIVAESLGIVQANANEIGQTLEEKATEYNLTVSDAILSPWKDGSIAVSDYQESFDTAMSSTMEQLELLKQKWQEVIDVMTQASNDSVGVINKENTDYTKAEKQEPKQEESSKPDSNSSNDKPQYSTYTVKSGDTLSGIAKTHLGSASKWQDIYNLNKDIISNPNLIYPGQKIKIPKYANGTAGVKQDQLAIVDEDYLEELVLGVENGRLTYLSKGSSVIPADITSNLMSWGTLDPQDMLDRNRPSIMPSKSIVNTEINLDCSVGTLVNIEHCDQGTLPDVEKLVNKAFEKHMQTLNNSIKRFTR